MPDTLDATTNAIKHALDKGIDYGAKALGSAFGPVAEGALAAFKQAFLKGLFSDEEVDFKTLLRAATNEIKESMRSLRNEELVENVAGLIYAFEQLSFDADGDRINLFLHDSALIMPPLESILIGASPNFSDPKWAYLNAPAYNLLVPLRAAAMIMANYDKDKEALSHLYRNALKINYHLIGEPICRDLHWEGGVMFACPPGTRCFLQGRLWSYPSLVHSFVLPEEGEITYICEPFAAGTLPRIRVRSVGHGSYGLEAPYSNENITTVCKGELEKRFFNDEVVATIVLANERILAFLGALRVSIREVRADVGRISVVNDIFGEDQPPCRLLRNQLEILMTRS